MRSYHGIEAGVTAGNPAARRRRHPHYVGVKDEVANERAVVWVTVHDMM